MDVGGTRKSSHKLLEIIEGQRRFAAGTGAGAFLVAIAVSIVHSGPAAAKYIVWLLTVFLMLRFLASVRRWYTSYIVITNYRFLLVSGKIAASPLADLKVLVTETSGFLGRLLGRYRPQTTAGSRSTAVMDGPIRSPRWLSARTYLGYLVRSCSTWARIPPA
jgi:hypothetical protein